MLKIRFSRLSIKTFNILIEFKVLINKNSVYLKKSIMNLGHKTKIDYIYQ